MATKQSNLSEEQLKERLLKDMEAEEEEAAKKRTSKDYVNMFKFYYLPIIVIAVFFGIMIKGTYPSLTGIFDTNDEIDAIQTKVEQMDKRLVLLNGLKERGTEIDEYLQHINQIAPVEKTKVTEFQQSVKAVAEQSNLEVIDSRAGEEIIRTDDEEAQQDIALVEIPAEFTLLGDFSRIKNFLTEIYQGGDFIVIHEMSFEKVQQKYGEAWQLKIILVKYQFIEPIVDESIGIIDTYNSVPEEARPDQTVLEFIDKKYKGVSLQQINQQDTQPLPPNQQNTQQQPVNQQNSQPVIEPSDDGSNTQPGSFQTGGSGN